jgi:hypothetical protein
LYKQLYSYTSCSHFKRTPKKPPFVVEFIRPGVLVDSISQIPPLAFQSQSSMLANPLSSGKNPHCCSGHVLVQCRHASFLFQCVSQNRNSVPVGSNKILRYKHRKKSVDVGPFCWCPGISPALRPGHALPFESIFAIKELAHLHGKGGQCLPFEGVSPR